MPDMNSDYTPSDFLAKLSIKSQHLEAPEQLRLSHQPKLTYGTSNSESPTIESIKKIQFKPLIPRRSLKNIYTSQEKSIKTLEGPNIKVLKINVTPKSSLNPQKYSMQSPSHQGSTVKTPQKIDNAQAVENKIKHQGIQKTSQQTRSFSQIYTEQQLMLKKTQMILEAMLKDQMSTYDIQKIITGLYEGLKNPQNFDQIIKNQAIDTQNDEKTKKHAKEKRAKQKNKSSSMGRGLKQGPKRSKRFKSEQKHTIIQRSKVEKRRLENEIKQGILKQVKQMKQLVILNEKSLRMSKKV